MAVDFGKTAKDYARYRAGFPSELFERLARVGVGTPGQNLLDLGTGSGALARTFARNGCRVTGLDPAVELLTEARRLDQEAGVSVSYVRGTAEAVGASDASFDAVTAAVCWHWFDPDRAAQEIRRVLSPGGALAIVHFQWLPSAVVDDSVRLMRRLSLNSGLRSVARRVFLRLAQRVKPEWVAGDGAAIHPDRLVALGRNGFERLESFSFDVSVAYSHEAWRGRLRSHAVVGASRSPSVVERFDAGLVEMLREKHPEDPLIVPHRVFVVVGRAPLHGVGAA